MDKPLFARPAPVMVMAVVGDEPPAQTTSAKKQNKTARARTLTNAPQDVGAEQIVTRNAAAAPSVNGMEEFVITLASTSQTLQNGAQPLAAEIDLGGLGAFSAETLVRNVNLVPIDQAVIAAPVEAADIRSIARALANMRNGPGANFGKIAQLTAGTPVEILDQADNGWMKLRNMDSGQVGWMADWLVTASN
ncbi:SH3 domain-containing protein [Roseovarius sp. LXJ103]|uniref:SH3 domain-containing protein n=1 Tax=Roseovarius carneus TaxID=2853164 RepID=UPI0015E81E75|nr:SH3 domain-containing protein [Roseovarius carneus]MBZ8117260.1 SH3 domain-containing protein [Roseovarius carneus]